MDRLTEIVAINDALNAKSRDIDEIRRGLAIEYDNLLKQREQEQAASQVAAEAMPEPEAK